MGEIADMIKKIASKQQMTMLIATVTSVDQEQCTCEVEPVNGNATRFDVRLRSVIDGAATGLVIFPTVGSTVIIGMIEEKLTNCFVVQYGEVDEIRLRGDQFAGLVKVQELVTKLNNLENKVNEIITNWNAFAGFYVPGSPSITGTPGTASEVSGILTETQQSDIENTTVKHG